MRRRRQEKTNVKALMILTIVAVGLGAGVFAARDIQAVWPFELSVGKPQWLLGFRVYFVEPFYFRIGAGWPVSRGIG